MTQNRCRTAAKTATFCQSVSSGLLDPGKSRFRVPASNELSIPLGAGQTFQQAPGNILFVTPIALKVEPSGIIQDQRFDFAGTPDHRSGAELFLPLRLGRASHLGAAVGPGLGIGLAGHLVQW